jgi:hypothetical protein
MKFLQYQDGPITLLSRQSFPRTQQQSILQVPIHQSLTRPITGQLIEFQEPHGAQCQQAYAKRIRGLFGQL